MKINTLQFGEIEYDENNIMFFEHGIIGFEQLKKYLFIKKEDDLFYWLNSTEDPNIAFPLFSIRVLDDNYPFQDNYEPFCIVNMDKDPLKITVNLKAPVYLDQDRKIGMQKILDTDNYSVNYNLFTE